MSIRLTASTTPYLIGMSTTPAKLNMRTTQPKVELHQEHGKVMIQTTAPKITIDQSQCFSESGLKGILELTRDMANESVSIMNESVGRIAEQGTELTNIHLGGNPIADQASYNAYDQFSHEFNMVTMPTSRPNIQLVRGTVRIQATGGKVDAKLIRGEVATDYSPGKVEIYARSKNSIQFQTTGTIYDRSI